MKNNEKSNQVAVGGAAGHGQIHWQIEGRGPAVYKEDGEEVTWCWVLFQHREIRKTMLIETKHSEFPLKSEVDYLYCEKSSSRKTKVSSRLRVLWYVYYQH